MKKMSLFKTLLITTSLFLIKCSGGGGGGAATDTSTTPETPTGATSLSLEQIQSCMADSSSSPDCPAVLSKQTVNKSFSASPTDILFVLDESCSMNVIANNLKTGFESLSESVYPENTKMAVTYMSPVKLNSDQSLDFSTPFNNKVHALSPGHLRLVNKTSILDYITAKPSFAADFAKPGCDDAWFDPTGTDALGNACLSAAVQLASVCTGVEAGAVALEQLMEKLNQSTQRLFRPEAIVDIIFVSDTHEPGANYFGLAGAPSLMKNFNEIQAAVLRNSPGIVSLKLGGILPLPVMGAPIYEGLRTVGPIPRTPEEAVVGTEEFWNYAYLPLIKESGGIVTHAKSDQWDEVAMQLVDDSRYMSQFTVAIQPTSKIYYVVINGNQLTQQQYNLGVDGVSLLLRYSAPKNTPLTIEVYAK